MVIIITKILEHFNQSIEIELILVDRFGSVPETFEMDDVGCIGTESSITKCSYTSRDDCGPGEGAGVQCTDDDSKFKY